MTLYDIFLRHFEVDVFMGRIILFPMDEEKNPLTFEFSISGCPFRDWTEIRDIMKYREYRLALNDIDESIRNRLKWTEGLSESEAKFLEDIRGQIWPLLDE